jgi:hypothetical protein
MSPQNNITFLRPENGTGSPKAEIDKRNRRRDWSEFWFFLSVWTVMTAVAGISALLLRSV